MNTEKHTMPALTEREREELICEARVLAGEYGGKHGELIEIALAALTAEPVAGWLLYTAPPVPVLKPIELPEVEKWRSVDQVRAQMSYSHLVADSLISAGYGVKE